MQHSAFVPNHEPVDIATSTDTDPFGLEAYRVDWYRLGSAIFLVVVAVLVIRALNAGAY